MPAPRSIPIGAPVWNDLSTSDLPAAIDFYTGLFGWEYECFGEDYGNYGQFSMKGAKLAGVAPLMAPDQPTTWTVYLQTPNVREYTARAEAAGAQVVLEPMDVMNFGAMSLIVDPGGAVVGLWQSGSHDGFSVIGEESAPVWHELLTTDYARSVEFYRDVLQWNVVVQGDTDEFRYAVYQSEGDDQHAGIMDASGFLPQEVPSHWGVYFGAHDTDACVDRAVELGASVAQPVADTPYGRMSMLLDPQGAPFRVISVR